MKVNLQPGPTWRMEIEINIRKYVPTPILSGLYKSVVDLQIGNVNLNVLSSPF